MDNKITLTVLAQMLSERTGRTRKECEDMLRSFFLTISQTLSAGEAVKVKGFGTFKISRVEARRSVDVTTGQDYEIPAHSRIVFLPAKELAAVVNRPFEMFETIELSDTLDDSQFAEAEEEDIASAQQEDSHEAPEEPAPEEPAPEEPAPEEPSAEESLAEESATEAPAAEEPAANPASAADSYEIEGDDAEEATGDEAVDEESESEDTVAEKKPTDSEPDEERKSAGGRRFRNGFIWGIVAAIAVLAAGASLTYMLNKDFSQKVNMVLGHVPADVPLAKSNAVAAGEEAKDVKVLADNVTEEINRFDTGEKGSSDLDIGADDKGTTGDEVPTQPSDKPVYDTITPTSALGTMARKHYGNYHFWPYIYKENEKILGHPDRIRPGTRVVIPPLSKYGVDPKNPADIAKAKRLDAEIYARYRK